MIPKPFFSPRLAAGIPSLWGVCILLLAGCQGPDAQQSEAAANLSEVVSSDTSDTSLTLEKRIDALTQEIKGSPTNYALYEDRSLVYYKMGETQNAQADIEKALELNPDGTNLYYLRGFYAYQNQDTATARQAYNQAEQLGSTNPEVFYQRGQLSFFQQKYEEAVADYRKAAELDSLDPTYPFAEGFLFQRTGNGEAAKEAYRKALELNPQFDKVLLQLHDLELDYFKDPLQASGYNDRVLERNPEHPVALYNKANHFYRTALVHRQSGEREAYQRAANEAVVYYTLAINKEANFADPYFFRGYCYFMGEERLDLAMEDFKKTLELDSTHVQAHFFLGSVYEYYQDLKSALAHYERASAYDPSFTDAKMAVKDLKMRLK
ncbi:MAG: tetratricopeptide repeat protein [Bacteroidota bacterium]